jgi:ATP-dependent RNA helicase RhlE
VSLDSLKINKQLKLALNAIGAHYPTEIQENTINRIIGGHDVVAIGPEGTGKSTALVMGVIARLIYAKGDAPRALVLVPTQEKVEEMVLLFEQLGVNTDLRVEIIRKGSNFDFQRDLLAEGVDVVIGTPERLQPFYYKTGINVTQLKMFVIDGADQITRLGTHTQTKQLGENMPAKCQHIVFTEVIHPKVENMIEDFLNFPTFIEVKAQKEADLDLIDSVLYEVRNFKTKLNLLNVLIGDAPTYQKVVVFVNNKLNASKVYKSLDKRNDGQIVLLNAPFFDQRGVSSVEDFMEVEFYRVLVVSTEDLEQTLDLSGLSYIIHFDLKDDKDSIINRVVRQENTPEDAKALFFATQNEVSTLRKIEQAADIVMPIEDLPIGTIIEGDVERIEVEEVSKISDDPNKGAFHKKKEKNSKDYNYGIRDKVEKFGKYKKKKGKRKNK